MGRSVLFALFVGLVALLPCKTLEVAKWVEVEKGAELVADCAWNDVVLCAVLDLKDVAVGVEGTTLCVVEIVGTIVDLGSEVMDDCIFDCTALDVCRVVKVTSDTVVVDCVVLEVCTGVALEVCTGVALEVCTGVPLEVCTGVALVVAGCAVEVTLPSNWEGFDVAASHMTVQPEVLVCILYGTNVQTLRVVPCMIGKPRESSVLLVTNPAKLLKAESLIISALLCKAI